MCFLMWREPLSPQSFALSFLQLFLGIFLSLLKINKYKERLSSRYYIRDEKHISTLKRTSGFYKYDCVLPVVLDCAVQRVECF